MASPKAMGCEIVLSSASYGTNWNRTDLQGRNSFLSQTSPRTAKWICGYSQTCHGNLARRRYSIHPAACVQKLTGTRRQPLNLHTNRSKSAPCVRTKHHDELGLDRSTRNGPSANQRRHLCLHTNTMMSSSFIVPRETLRLPTNVDTSVFTQTSRLKVETVQHSLPVFKQQFDELKLIRNTSRLKVETVQHSLPVFKQQFDELRLIRDTSRLKVETVQHSLPVFKQQFGKLKLIRGTSRLKVETVQHSLPVFANNLTSSGSFVTRVD